MGYAKPELSYLGDAADLIHGCIMIGATDGACLLIDTLFDFDCWLFPESEFEQ